MALNNPKDLFLYELAAMRNAEISSGQMLGWAAGQVRNPELAQLLRTQEQESQQQLKSIESCFQALGASAIDVPSQTVDGMRSGLEDFVALQPSPEVLELFTLGAAMRLAHFGIASYRGLVSRAVVMGESHCADKLQTNLVQKEENAGRLERVGHELHERVFATA